MKYWIGLSIIGIGTLHCIVGGLVLGHVFQELLGEGLFNTVNQQPLREAFYWFMAFGLLLMLFGWLIYWLEQQAVTLPRNLAILLSVFLVILLFIMPISGAWLMWVPVGGIFWKNRRGQRT